MKVVVKFEGGRACERALAELPKATGKNVLRRIGRGALEPMKASAKARAPKETGQLAGSIVIKATPNKAYKSAARQSFLDFGSAKGVKADRSKGIYLTLAPEARKGTNLYFYAYYQEYGTVNMAANPYMRPAWDMGAQAAFDFVQSNLMDEIQKAAARSARKAAKG